MKNKAPKKSKIKNTDFVYGYNTTPDAVGSTKIKIEPMVEPPPEPGTQIVREGTTAGKPGDIVSAADRWRENYNPLRGLTMRRAVELLEMSQRGDTAYCQWAYRFIERRIGVVPGLVSSCEAPISGFQWAIKINKEVSEGEDEEAKAMAEAQAETLKEAYSAIDNLRAAILHLHMADFRGYAHVQKHRNADGDTYHLEVLDQWTVCRDGLNGNWFWNPRSRATSTPLSYLGAKFCIGYDSLPLSDFIIRECPRPIDEMAITYAVRWLELNKNWDGFIAVYGLPSGVVTLPPNIKPSDENLYTTSAQRVAEGGNGCIPYESKYEANDGPRGTDPFTPRNVSLDQTMILAGTGGKLTMLAESGSGTLAGGAHADTFNNIAMSRAAQISECFQKQFDQEILAEQHPGEPTLAYFTLQGDPSGVDSIVKNVTSLSQAGKQADTDWLNEKTGYKLTDAPLPPEAAPEPSPIVRNRRIHNTANPDATTPLETAGARAMAKALAPDVATLNERLAQCLEGPPELIQTRLQQFVEWIDKNAVHFARNPALADAIQETMSAALANGLEQPT